MKKLLLLLLCVPLLFSCVERVGCMDSIANNYNTVATVDDGSCIYSVFDSTLRDTVDWKIKYKMCPVCKKKDKVIPIIYGLRKPYDGKGTVREHMLGGGCIIYSDSPRWYCKRDKIKF